MRQIIVVIALCVSAMVSCNRGNNRNDVRNIEIFESTEIRELAQLAEGRDVTEFSEKVQEFKHKLNTPDKQYGFTLLMWCIKMEKYNFAQILLQHGADPNVRSKNGKTALFYATEYSWLDDAANGDATYISLLLKYNADPNIPYAGDGDSNVIDKGTTPLIHAAGRSLEKVKALVNGGAVIDYRTKRCWTAANEALLNKKVEISQYLIVDKKADIKQPYFYFHIESDSVDVSDKRYPVELLRDWVFDLNSKEYKTKMQIVEEFQRQGVDYKETSPSMQTLNHIKKLYPNTWEDYLANY